MAKAADATPPAGWEGWEVAVVRFYPRLLKYALRLAGGNREVAEDIVHEAIASVLITNPVPREPEAAFGYLQTAVRNAFFSLLKRSLRLVSYDDEQNTSLPPGLVDEQAAEDIHGRVENEERSAKALKLIGPLPRLGLQIYLMHVSEGMSVKEIADDLGMPESLVCVELNATRALVNSHLQRKNFNPDDY